MAFNDDDREDIRTIWEKLRPWLLGVMLATTLGALYTFLATRGPRAVDARAASGTLDDQTLAAFSGEVNAHENAWRAAKARGEAGRAEAQTALATAVAKQRERVRRDPRSPPAESERLAKLERLVADEAARDTLARSAALELEAEAARTAGELDTAAEKFREALALQAEVNRGGASADVKDLPRETRLRMEVEAAEAAPLAHVVTAARAKAETAARAQRWLEARAALEEARMLQGRINREFPGTRFVDLAAEEDLEAELATLQATSLADAVRTKADAGEAATLAGKHEEAAKFFAEALAAQETINARHARSRYFSAAMAEDLEARRQTALSEEILARLKTLETESVVLLRARESKAAQEKIAEAAKLAASLWEKLPRSQRLDAELRERVSFRAAQADRLAAIQEAVFAELAPSAPPVWRGATQQSLYALVMGKNPSRVPGDALRVESVSWDEAHEFCRKLGWLLGRTVRLPAEAEFQAAYDRPMGNPENISGLRAGVAEWLDAPMSEPTALIARASDSQAAGGEAAAIEFVATPKTERNRTLGFRFVVE